MTAPAAATAAADAQAAQTGLVLALGTDLAAAWARLDVSALRTSLPDFTALVAALVRRYSPASATLAARFYKQQRAAAGVTAPFRVLAADPPSLQQVGTVVDWATQPLWATQPDVTVAQAKVQGAVEKLVLDTGRNTVIDNARRDRHAIGWARVTEPDPCSFCALLAIRGAVYKKDTAGFRSHDNCRCHAEPVFDGYTASPQVEQWRQLYRDSTTGGNAARTRREWRRAYEAQATQQ